MLRSYLYVSLFLSASLVLGGCAKKTVPDIPPSPAPVVTQPSSNLPDNAAIEVDPVAPPTVEKIISFDEKKMETVFFEYDSYMLTTVAQQLLRESAKRLDNNRKEKVTLEGHCDERGSDEYNLALGERRALAVKNYLLELGVASERLITISYGEERPTHFGKNEMAWKQNRRVEFKSMF